VSLGTLARMKREGDKIACITCYDASFAVLCDNADVDLVLVGDSLGMVLQGHDTTVPVTMDDVIYHSKAVARGAEMVKLESGINQLEIVEFLARHDIAVCAHLGLKPQSVHKTGGFRVQGRDDAAAQRMLENARALESAGADIVLLECIPSELGKRITQALEVPVIGIGAGPDTDGQILVLYDVLDITSGRKPRFVKNFMEGASSNLDALGRYVHAVKQKTYPAPEHEFHA
jgi:3-methyl-2-oxobutanoate hydroxymethyltransferase